MRCVVCRLDLARASFSKSQIKKVPEHRTCKKCCLAPGLSFVPCAGQGCHLAHNQDAGWLVDSSRYSAADFGVESDSDVPDMSLDPETSLLSLINTDVRAWRCVYLSAVGCVCRDADGGGLETGVWRKEDGDTVPCTTFIVIVPPRRVLDLCFIDAPSLDAVDIQSDIQPYTPPDTSFELPAPITLGFPLAGPGPYLCTQGVDGALTHFAHASTRHAIDLQCRVGTPILSPCSGTVSEVIDHNTVSGIHVSNLFKWNYIVLVADDGTTLVELVHIQQNSARVKAGARIARGDQLCCSGDVGFCPEPHLHMEVHASTGRAAPSVPFKLECCEVASSHEQTASAAHTPLAGHHYRPSQS